MQTLKMHDASSNKIIYHHKLRKLLKVSSESVDTSLNQQPFFNVIFAFTKIVWMNMPTAVLNLIIQDPLGVDIFSKYLLLSSSLHYLYFQFCRYYYPIIYSKVYFLNHLFYIFVFIYIFNYVVSYFLSIYIYIYM